ncbi:MAG TPA: BTAD domain-containing putative transcriptional regulator, partial [Armatimonadota bacterium]|nr:BTAD domain-containing putative transcriptional regulator [Armatimonadota bacterium]
MAGQIRIELFSGLKVREGERVVARFPTRKTASLLGFLAYYSRHRHPREVLIELLWPESDLDAGRKSLGVALSALRQVLELGREESGRVLLADRLTVQLSPERVTTDVAELEAALAAATRARDPAERESRLLRAVELYTGELLPGLYEEWIPREGEWLRDRVLDALTELARLAERDGRTEAALAHTRRAVALDPIREETHREMMRLLGGLGRVPEALRQYRDMEEILRRELEIHPSAVSRELAEALRSGRVSTLHTDHRPPPPEPTAPRLPAYWTSFLGRAEEMDALREALRPGEARVVTLTGPGGSGKTRLAREAAQAVAEWYSGAAWFVALADLADAERLPGAIARSIDAPLGQGTNPLAATIEILAGRPALLVLDNFEQLLPSGAAYLRSLLERLPALVCLITSRRRVGLTGERELAVSPLAAAESVQLFLDRARSARPDFQLTPQNRQAVLTLCERLEGVPLALELAAARARVLTPEQMLEQLAAQPLQLLHANGDREARHRSLDAAVGWSYRLLPGRTRLFFAALSVFHGGWSLEAAEAVWQGPDTLDLLVELHDCSMIQAEPDGGRMR